VEFVINFLSELFMTGMEYSTVNGYRSAISDKHSGLNGVKVGQNEQVCQLMKGMFNRRPPQPRYMETWDVSKVLDLFRKWPLDESLELKQLSLKVTMLMALTGAMRQSELHLLQTDQMLDKGNMIEFHIGGLTKTRKAGQGPIVVSFASYPSDRKLDVVASIRAYVARTHHHRGVQTQLLLSFVKPHGPIVACSIAKWLRTVMEMAGIDVEKYKAHSTRSAATSKAKQKGLTAHEIMTRANWLRENTFLRYYCRESESQGFQQAVLQ